MSYVPSLKKLYVEHVVPELVKSRSYKNKHEVPKLVKINLNTGIDAEADKNQITDIQRDLGLIAGQKPVLAKSRKAIANFKLKPNQVVGCHVTLRGPAMWDFLQRLIAVALPTIRDFRGLPSKLDGQGNYNLGITDHTIFPEITVENVKKHIGLDIAIVTTAETDDEARELLRLLGMPFRRTETVAPKPAHAA
ncbi:50S ribosomal protein L5 [Opitutus terrae]|uniref:Large ribosomal subunit protein uL5 n=1 Tax=Opitutus terrae (strain DSM 11246 / JCM 15787 / PB90-1) TaxID=452637 RepID=B1ZND6_OPITP|nr:50S ribosomal protein L5 [Opitutus terrae]ACB73505.1 ribosomal protein L5 [Opitutus terrae PB90-1]